ncbi:MAG: single-stranded DNA-binding protein [Candidatus Kapabacteria bacterium]|nr:single-stranded DNA-binding protein [Ignavibacteriota bacterium]MCW5883997.1 single-stranded DNA-binding protein [Candidatus Kapabacteria bacterium]
MSRALNKVMLIGNVGKQPELKHTPSGIPVAHFRLATSESWRDKDGNFAEHTDWHTIVAWRSLAEIVMKIVHKGTRIFVEGKLRTRKFEDKNNVKRFYVEIIADNILLLDNKRFSRDNSENHTDADNVNDDYDFDYDNQNDSAFGNFNNDDELLY